MASATPCAASTETVTATRSFVPMAAASEPPPPWDGDKKLDAVMNWRAAIVDAATLPFNNPVSVTAAGGMLPRSTFAGTIRPFWTAFSPVVPFAMSCEATYASTTATFRWARLSADDT